MAGTHSTPLPLAILPHPAAPLFAQEKNPQLVLQQVMQEVASGRFPMNAAFLNILRQTCFVSLYFLLRYVASVTGPYEKLNTGLHLEMCNFMQSADVMGPGARSAMILSRGFYKSTIGNHGHNTFLALRDPNIRIRNVSNIVERGHEFKNVTQRFFDSNPLARELFGATTFVPAFDTDPRFIWKGYIPGKNAKRWNENEFVLPNRTRVYTEPTISAGGATGASEGIHVDVLKLDDIEGLDDLSADHRSNMNMQAKKKWFNTNTTSLLVDRTSRIHLNGTFYGSDDVHSQICDNARAFRGYHDPEFPVRDGGEWVVYYRSWKEGDSVTFPEVMDEERYAKLLEKDPWSAITQYGNKPRDPAMSEFYAMPPKRASLHFSEQRRRWFIRRGAASGSVDENWEDTLGDSERWVALSDCDIRMAVDPAGTDKGITAKTSRTAIGIGAMDWEENIYLVWSRTGYYSITKTFDLIFEGCMRFDGLVREVGVEKAAMQKIIAPLLRKESAERKYYINPQGIDAGGDKEARIRSNVGRALMRGKVYLIYGEDVAFEEERLVFPGNENRRDTLDMFEKLCVRLRAPLAPGSEDEVNAEDLEYEYAQGRSDVTGY